MSQPNSPRYVACPCQHCGGKIEFDANLLDVTGASGRVVTGQTIPCPHCRMDTILFIPPAGESSKPESKPAAKQPIIAWTSAVFFALNSILFASRFNFQNAKPLLKILGFVVVGTFGLFVLFFYENDTTATQTSSTIEIAERFILSGLKSPTTAKFSGASFEQRGSNVFLVSGYVDSQNSFGAMLRGTWLCLISNTPPNHWSCILASVDGTPIISPEPAQNLELLSSQIVVSRDETSLQPEQHKYKLVKGVVKNISAQPLKSIFITYNLYNSEGDLAGFAKANNVLFPLKPGEIWEFTTESFDFDLTPKLNAMESYHY